MHSEESTIGADAQARIREVVRNLIQIHLAELHDVPEMNSGTPMNVREYKGESSYIRTPIVGRVGQNTRHVGFVDLKITGEHSDEYDVVRYSLPPSGSKDTLSDLPTTITELQSDEIEAYALTKATPGARSIACPNLVYLGVEVRTAWHCRIETPEGRVLDVFVTPGVAFVPS